MSLSCTLTAPAALYDTSRFSAVFNYNNNNLTSPFKSKETRDPKNECTAHRTFTASIHSVKHLHYCERLKSLDLYFLEHWRKRYIVISTWEILEGLAPNLHTSIISHKINAWHTMQILPIKSRGVISTPRKNSLSLQGPRLLNTLPLYIRRMLTRPLDFFSRELDKFLYLFLISPSAYVVLSEAGTSSLVN